jgi:putative membrane protein
MSSFFAFLHHLAAFALVATLVLEFVLVKGPLDAATARRLRITDMLFGLSSGVVLVVGLLRVYHFEKGAEYYFHSAPFIAKLALFVVVGLLSIYPTVVFASWGKALRQGQAPVLADAQRRKLRAVMHAELAGVVLILLCAALMARGVGTFG